jgi:Na+/H+-dicarboxylate symporter
MKMINLIMLYAPIGLGAYFASLVGTYGAELVNAYAKAVIMFFPICIVYFLTGFTAYAYYAGGTRGVRTFYANILPAVVTSLATQSSVATLPTNLNGTKRMGVPEDISNIVLPLGATIATMINATGDAVAAMIVTRHVEGKDWMQKSYVSAEEVTVG